MIGLIESQWQLVFLVFCRTGTALMLLPGFSSPRVPLTVRLFLAFAVTLTVYPVAIGEVPNVNAPGDIGNFVSMIAQELAMGALIGMAGSVSVQAVRFSGDVISNCIGLAGIPGQPVDTNEPLGQIASLLTLTTTFAIFNLGLHLKCIDALIETYGAVGLGQTIDVKDAYGLLLSSYRDAFISALQIASPFIAYSLLTNLIIGLVSRIAPKAQIYFSVTGLVALTGLWMISVAAPQILSFAPTVFGNWLDRLTQ
jgi:flagellar biosynthesis protein FliR